MPSQPTLEDRFLGRLDELGLRDRPARLLVAVSGGCDSVCLLHLLRFAGRALPLTVAAAHLDHAMRAGSAADASWVAGLCAAWDVPLVRGRLVRPPTGEDAARRARYAFLRTAARETGSELILTAHHADDQAETVLFRVLRGTGLHGLGGMPARSAAGLVRPLLPFWRRELVRYARAHGLRWRRDPTNASLDAARNRIRNRLLPEIERHVAPGARRNLVALAELARESEAAWERFVEPLARELAREEEGALVLARDRLRGYDSAVASRILRSLLRRFGVVPGRSGTRTALQFITDAPSGREMELPGGLRIRLEYDRARLERAVDAGRDEPAEIPAPPPERGEARMRLGGRSYRVAYWTGPWTRGAPAAEGRPWCAALDLAGVRFPLRLRGWLPGDRMRTAGGTKSLKRLFAEERVPRSRRARLPVLTDAAGEVLWVAGLRRPPRPAPSEGAEALFLAIANV